jgi:multiple sugar transport system substrate-binding protein
MHEQRGDIHSGAGDPRLLGLDEIGTGNFYDTLVSRFEAGHPNVHINLTSYPEDNYDVKVQTAMAAHQEPDLILSFGPQNPKRGLLLPLDGTLAQHGVDLSTFSKAIISEGGEYSCGWKGKLYCIGTYSGIATMLYNKDMFDAAGIAYPKPWPPMTPDQFVDIACKLTNPDHRVWGGDWYEGDAVAMSLPWETLVSPDGKTAEGYVNGPTEVHQYDIMSSAYKRGCLPSSNILQAGQGVDFFAESKLGMVVGDYLGLKKVQAAGINWGTTAVPTPKGYPPYFFSWSDSVGVMATTDHPDEAKEFVAFVATQGQKIRFETTGDIPLDSKVADKMNWAGGIPGREEGLQIAKHARAAIFIPDRWNVYAPLYDAWGYIVSGNKSVKQALDDAASAIQQNLDKAWDVWNKQS